MSPSYQIDMCIDTFFGTVNLAAQYKKLINCDIKIYHYISDLPRESHDESNTKLYIYRHNRPYALYR